MMTLEWPLMLAALPLPLLVLWLLPRTPERKAGALSLPFFDELVRAGLVSGGGGGGARRGARLAALGLIWALLVLAAARPVYRGAAEPIPTEGREVVLAIDLSASMAQEDMRRSGAPASRLRVVKDVADAFLAARTGDRVGLILFGTRPYIQAPLTFDLNVVRELLGETTVGMVGGSTAIGDAIGLAVKTMREHPAKDRVLILLTDGVNTAGALEPMMAAELARNENVKIHTIGVGSDGGILMPGQFAANTSDLDEPTLKAVSALTGGRYFRARDEAELLGIYAEIDRMEPAAGEPRYVTPITQLFHLPLGLALVLSMAFAALLLVPGGLRAARSAAPAGEER